jgi:hypothetical protein
MQLAAFLICAICGRITRKNTQSIHTKETHVSPADFADNADEPQTAKQQKPHHTNLSFSAE